jgi:hypothetical protein
MTKKFDGVIEAVRYKNGQILLVRAYERRGPAFSDHVLLERKALLELLQKGKKFVTGSRVELRGGIFNIQQDVLLVHQDGNKWIATRPTANQDVLEGTPFF